MRAFAACTAVASISAFALVWVAMPTIHAVVPVWVIVDSLVAQIVLVTALSGAVKG